RRGGGVIVWVIVGMDEAGGIGKEGALPWRLSSDLRRFKEMTMGHHVIAGRKTFESIGKALAGRHTIVVTSRPDYDAPGCHVVHSLGRAIELARSRGESEAFVIGGGQIYQDALSMANRIYLTQVHAQVGADTFFPELDPGQWRLEE